jgi:hypothetical protein
MALITINTPRKHRDGHGGAIKPYVVATGVTIPAGAFVGLTAAGFLTNWSVVTAGSLRFVGMAMSRVVGDAVLTMPVNDTGIELRGVAVAGASTIADLTPGKLYLLNNNDLSISAPAAGGVMGRITKFYDATHFDVKLYTSAEYAAQADI